MMKRLVLLIVLCMAVAGGLPRFAYALSTPNLPLESPIYRDVERMVGLGYAKPTILGQRPWARSEVARLIAQAIAARRERRETEEKAAYDSFHAYSKMLRHRHAIDRLLSRLTDEFHEELIEMGAIPGEKHELRIHPLEEAHFGVIGMKSPPTVIPYDNGEGTINAVVNPLGDYRVGRHAVDGLQGSIETVHRFGLTPYFSILLRPRFEASVARVTGDGDASALIQDFYAVVEVKNFAFEFGRDSVVWGLGQRGGNMLTYNARPLDSVRITNPHPARLPWVFRHLGEWKYTLFGANLGPEYTPKWAWLTGWKVSLMPSQWVELGIGHLAFMGGEGTPSMSALDIVGEFAGFRPSGSVNKANQMFEFGLLVRVPPWRGMQIYGMLTNEDKRDSVKRFFRDGSAYLFGVHLPALGTCGNADLRVEYTRTCALCFRHSLFSDGATLNRKLLGTDLGPDADGIHSEFNYDISDRFGWGVVFDWDHRRSNLKATEIEPDGSLGDVITVAYRPTEDRYRTVLAGRWRLSKYTRMVAQLGYERVTNYQYVQGDDRNNFMASLLLSIDFDRKFYFTSD